MELKNNRNAIVKKNWKSCDLLGVLNFPSIAQQGSPWQPVRRCRPAGLRCRPSCCVPESQLRGRSHERPTGKEVQASTWREQSQVFSPVVMATGIQVLFILFIQIRCLFILLFLANITKWTKKPFVFPSDRCRQSHQLCTTRLLSLVTSLSPSSSLTRPVLPSASSPSTVTPRMRTRGNSLPRGEIFPLGHFSKMTPTVTYWFSFNSSGTGQRTNVISCVTVHDSHDSDSSTSSPLSPKTTSQPAKALAVILPSVKSQPGESTNQKAPAGTGPLTQKSLHTL